MAEKYLKRCSTSLVILSHQGNANQNYLNQSEWPKSIKQMIAHAGEDVEQGEHSFIAGGSTNLYSHYGNHWW